MLRVKTKQYLFQGQCIAKQTQLNMRTVLWNVQFYTDVIIIALYFNRKYLAVTMVTEMTLVNFAWNELVNLFNTHLYIL